MTQQTGSPPDIASLPLCELAPRLQRREFSPSDLVRAYLARIDALDPELRAWELVDREGALQEAARQEQSAQASEPGPLAGIPLGVKDIIAVQGMPTKAGFAPFAGNVAQADAIVIARLRQAGAIVMGKTVTTQFAYIDPPPTRNPWRADRTPGGSSSGSAVAVASGMVPAALGSQTAGSLLRPASYCGVVALKPTFGRVSRAGVLPFSWSLDHIGVIVRRVMDAAMLLQAMAGYDRSDGASARRPVPDYAAFAAVPMERPRFGVVFDLVERSRPQVRSAVERAITRLRGAGAAVQELRLPAAVETILGVQQVIMQSEGAAVHASLLAQHPDDYGPKIRSYVEVGQLIPADLYLHAQRIRARLRRQLGLMLRNLDALVMPTVSDVAPDPSTTGDASFQALWTLFGWPALTLPVGLGIDRLPIGLQLVAGPFQEAKLLRAGRWCEDVLGHLPMPVANPAP